MDSYTLCSRPVDEEVVTVVAAGNLDLRAAPALKDALLSEVEHGARHVVADLTAVTSFDSTTLGVLLGIQARLFSTEGWLSVVCGAALRSMIHFTALDEILDVRESVAAALQVADPAPARLAAGLAA